MNLDALQCIVVHWWGVEAEVVKLDGHAFHITVAKSSLANQVFLCDKIQCILANLDALQCIVVYWWGVEAEVVY